MNNGPIQTSPSGTPSQPTGAAITLDDLRRELAMLKPYDRTEEINAATIDAASLLQSNGASFSIKTPRSQNVRSVYIENYSSGAGVVVTVYAGSAPGGNVLAVVNPMTYKAFMVQDGVSSITITATSGSGTGRIAITVTTEIISPIMGVAV
jgi:hypothetical protein